MQMNEAAAGDTELADNDLGPLAWVLEELKKSLDGASKAIRRFVRDADLARGANVAELDASQLRIARQQLHQAAGALEMVGLPAPAKLMHAMEVLTQKFVQRPELCSDDAAIKIERAGFALAEYLEGVLKGKTASSVALFPQYRDVLELVGGERVHPADLWTIAWSWVDAAMPISAPPTAYDPKVRALLDQNVLRVVKTGDRTAALALRDASLSLAAGQPVLDQRVFWSICAAFFEATGKGLCTTDVYAKRAASRVLLQYATLARGEPLVSERLAQDLLFFCAQAQPARAADAPTLVALRAAYRLDKAKAFDYETPQFGRFDPAVLVQARKRIASATETWSSLAGGDTNRLKVVTDQFNAVSDSMLKLHPENGELARALARAVEVTVRSGEPPLTSVAMEVATSVLYLEAAYEDMDPTDSQMGTRSKRLAQRLEQVVAGGKPEPLEGWMKDLYRRVSDRQTMGSVVDELRTTLGEIEKCLDQFFRQPQDKTPLGEVPSKLAQMRGVFSVLGLDQASLATLRMRDSVEKFLVDDVGPGAVRSGVFEKIGGSLGALGFLIDMLSYQRVLAKKLFVYDELAGEFKPVAGVEKPVAAVDQPVKEPVPPVIAPLTFTLPAQDLLDLPELEDARLDDSALDDSPISEPFALLPSTSMGLVASPAATAPNAVPEPLSMLAPTPPGLSVHLPVNPPETARLPVIERAVASAAASTVMASGFTALVPTTLTARPVPSAPQATPVPATDDDEAEIRDIFLDEAREVVANGLAACRALKANHSSLGEQTTLRRAFHTLKGSSRMVGLHEFGEAAWSMEQMLNSWLAEQAPASDALVSLSARALTGFGSWVEDIAANADAKWRAQPFCDAADAMRIDKKLVVLHYPGSTDPASQTQPLESAMPKDAAASRFHGEPEFQNTDIAVSQIEAGQSVYPDFVSTEAFDPNATQSMTLTADAASAAEMTSLGRDDFDFGLAAETAKVPEAANQANVANVPDVYDAKRIPSTPAASEFASFEPTNFSIPDDMGSPDAHGDDITSDSIFPPALMDSRFGDGRTADSRFRDSHLRDSRPGAYQPEPAPVRLPTDSQPEIPQAKQPIEPSVQAESGTENHVQNHADEHVREHVEERPEARDEPVKVIGPLRIGIPLYNVYLNEADEWSRRLLVELSEWALELHRPVSDTTVALAHSLGGSSATVGFAALSEIARALEQALQHVQLHARSDEKHAQVFSLAAEDIRRLLHQFAAGFLKEPDREILDALKLIAQTDFPTSHQLLDQRSYQHDSDSYTERDFELSQQAESRPGLLSPAAFSPDMDAVPGNLPTVPPAAALPVRDALSPEPVPSSFAASSFAVPASTAPSFASSSFDTASYGTTALNPPAYPPAYAAPSGNTFPDVPVHAPTLPAATLNLAAAPLLMDDHDDDIDLVDALDADLFPIFEEEALELMPRLGGALRQWAARPDNLNARNEVLRVLHTLKGSARLAGAMRLGEMTHRLESVIEQMGSEGLENAQLDPILTRFDALNRSFDALRSGSDQVMVLPEALAAANPSVLQARTIRPTTALAPLRQIANASVRVRSQLLDRLVNQAGEVMLTRSRLASRLGQLKVSLADLSGNLDRLRGQLRDIEVQSESQMQSRMALAKDSALDFDPLEFDRFTRVQELTRMMAESVNDVATVQRNLQRSVEGTEDDLIAQGRQARELQRDLLRTRMVEFEGISERLYGVVRQAAKDAGKQVRLDITGGSMDIDRGVLERMAPAFEHLLRNSVAHGIEDPAGRVQAGKPVAGTITIDLQHQSNEVSVEFNDDGAGLDLPRIREKAVSSGVAPDAYALTDAQAADLIFAPGFTTAASVTELAGRGIGMDVVRSEVIALGGRIETSSERGRGTRFKLVLPLTTAVTQVVMLRLGELVIGVAANVTEVVKRVPSADLEQAYRTGQFMHAGVQIPFFWAGALLQASPHSEEATAKNLPVAVFRSAGQWVAVHVDEVLGNQEVVVKNLGPQLSRLPGLTGMSVLASGAVVLIYNPVALASVYGDQAGALRLNAQALLSPGESALSGRSLTAMLGSTAQAPLIMVVDDSITVRRVTQRLLKREGYRVVLASDGLHALELLQDEKPTLVLSDIEMPRMDGFDLARNIRSDLKLRDLPIIMITSRIATKHRDHARELGVDHYLGKPYSEDELMGLVRHYCSTLVEA